MPQVYGLYLYDQHNEPLDTGTYDAMKRRSCDLSQADQERGWIIAPLNEDPRKTARQNAWTMAGCAFVLFGLFVLAMMFDGC